MKSYYYNKFSTNVQSIGIDKKDNLTYKNHLIITYSPDLNVKD